jgi:hypothetical protein
LKTNKNFSEFRQIFGHLQHKVISTYGPDHIARYTAVSGNKIIKYLDISYQSIGFIFLRFFGPAILGPKLFGLSKGKKKIFDATNFFFVKIILIKKILEL